MHNWAIELVKIKIFRISCAFVLFVVILGLLRPSTGKPHSVEEKPGEKKVASAVAAIEAHKQQKRSWYRLSTGANPSKEKTLPSYKSIASREDAVERISQETLKQYGAVIELSYEQREDLLLMLEVQLVRILLVRFDEKYSDALKQVDPKQRDIWQVLGGDESSDLMLEAKEHAWALQDKRRFEEAKALQLRFGWTSREKDEIYSALTKFDRDVYADRVRYRFLLLHHFKYDEGEDILSSMREYNRRENAQLYDAVSLILPKERLEAFKRYQESQSRVDGYRLAMAPMLDHFYLEPVRIESKK